MVLKYANLFNLTLLKFSGVSQPFRSVQSTPAVPKWLVTLFIRLLTLWESTVAAVRTPQSFPIAVPFRNCPYVVAKQSFIIQIKPTDLNNFLHLAIL